MTVTETDQTEQAAIDAEAHILEGRLHDVAREIYQIDARRSTLISERDELIGVLNSPPYKRSMRRLAALMLDQLSFQAVGLISREWRGLPKPVKTPVKKGKKPKGKTRMS